MMIRKTTGWAFSAALALCMVLASAPAVQAQDGASHKMDAAMSISDNLNSLKGKSVTLYLSSGNSVSGKVANVAGGNVHIAEISGKEYFDAMVRIDAVIGFEARAR